MNAAECKLFLDNALAHNVVAVEGKNPALSNKAAAGRSLRVPLELLVLLIG
jgi:hypothetical protein